MSKKSGKGPWQHLSYLDAFHQSQSSLMNYQPNSMHNVGKWSISPVNWDSTVSEECSCQWHTDPMLLSLGDTALLSFHMILKSITKYASHRDLYKMMSSLCDVIMLSPSNEPATLGNCFTSYGAFCFVLNWTLFFYSTSHHVTLMYSLEILTQLFCVQNPSYKPRNIWYWTSAASFQVTNYFFACWCN